MIYYGWKYSFFEIYNIMTLIKHEAFPIISLFENFVIITIFSIITFKYIFNWFKHIVYICPINLSKPN